MITNGSLTEQLSKTRVVHSVLNSTHLDPLEDHQEVGDKNVAAKLEVLQEVHGHADDGS